MENAVNGLWGKKIGMTQVFSDKNIVVPVTVIDIAHWYVTQVKTLKKDGYGALQLGCVKKKYSSEPFSVEWIKKPKKYFSDVREVAFEVQDDSQITVGQPFDQLPHFAKGELVDVAGTSRGLGFQGVIKRYGFSGGRASHGAKLGRAPGSLSFMRSEGRVIKGKKMPGRMGGVRVSMKNLEIVTVEPETRVMIIKGSVPGKIGSLVFVRKCR